MGREWRRRAHWLPACAGPTDPCSPSSTDLSTNGIAFGVVVWSDDGEAMAPDAHLDRLRTLAFADAPGVVSLATDAVQLARMIDVAGPIIAWQEG
jgi:hypothetical protein